MTDWSELIRAVAELVKALQWPFVALIVAAFFKHEIRKLFRRFRKGKFMGAEAEFDAVVEKLEEGTQQEQQETKTRVIPQTASISVSPEGSKSKPPDKAIDMFEEEVRLTRAWDPQGALKLLIREVGNVARERAETWSKYGPMPYRHRSVTGAFAFLAACDLISDQTQENSRYLLLLDNLATHERIDDMDVIRRAIDSGLSILRTLREIPDPS